MIISYKGMQISSANNCGAAGIRTLVQTMQPKAFYMFISAWVFDNRQVRNNRTGYLSFIVSRFTQKDKSETNLNL